MPDNLEKLKEAIRSSIDSAGNEQELESVRIKYLGRSGEVTAVLKSLSLLDIEERKEKGRLANLLRDEAEKLIIKKLESIERANLTDKLKNEQIDVTLPPMNVRTGKFHPIKVTMNEISKIFKDLGFVMAEGPEIETDWYNFEALNIPKDHPARDTQDTFYLKDDSRLLRTHTSPVQIHTMEKTKPPLRIIAPGRVYRNEATDASHAAVFHQIEGLAVDENITFADLKGTLTLFVHKYFGKDVKVRFRASHFQFTEPSAELDIACTICQGKGCRVCKNEGWLEMLGCGMVHPNVLNAVNYDSEKYTGFAFGMGLERLTMFKYSIDDIRLFGENNLKFLRQF